MSWANRKLVPASCAHLDPTEVERALVANFGNVTATARKVGVPPQDLRQLVWSSSLADTVYELIEQTLDEAQQVLRDALRGDDKARRLHAATVLLTQSEAGRRRGWGTHGALPDEAPEGRAITLKWLDEPRLN
jgi:hypothetical protein